MAAKKKPISAADLRRYEQANLPRGGSGSSGASSGIGVTRPAGSGASTGIGVTRPAGTGLGTGVGVSRPSGSGMSTGVGVGRPGPILISSKDAPRNLQGAPQNTALRIIGGKPVVSTPTKPELDKIRDTTAPGRGGGGDGGNPYAKLLQALTGLGDYAAGNINSSMDALTSTLQAQANPFANFTAQQTQTTPELSQLLQSQGVSQDPLQQFATAINAQNQGQATAFQNQANIMRDIYGANQTGSIGDVSQQRASLLNQLQGNVLGSGAKLLGGTGKKALDSNTIAQMLLSAMKAGQ